MKINVIHYTVLAFALFYLVLDVIRVQNGLPQTGDTNIFLAASFIIAAMRALKNNS